MLTDSNTKLCTLAHVGYSTDKPVFSGLQL